jgi:fatty acid desaturase
MYKYYKKDPWFFIKYNSVSILALAAGSIFLYTNWSVLPEINNNWLFFLAILPLCLTNVSLILFSAALVSVVAITQGYFVVGLRDLLLLPLAVVIGLQSAWLMHNAAHESIKPAWLNRLIGELTGLHQLSGYPGWAVFHIIHHQNSDDPVKDPHPPVHLTFREYFGQMGPLMGRVAHNAYFELWGENDHTRRLWRMMVWCSLICRYMRAAFLLILLGPTIFVLCFIVSKVINYSWYVHFNYATHRPNAEGDIEILNLNHNLYYNIMNATMAGAYFHKNHHRKASLFDPRTLEPEQAAKSLVSYKY